MLAPSYRCAWTAGRGVFCGPAWRGVRWNRPARRRKPPPPPSLYVCYSIELLHPPAPPAPPWVGVLRGVRCGGRGQGRRPRGARRGKCRGTITEEDATHHRNRLLRGGERGRGEKERRGCHTNAHTPPPQHTRAHRPRLVESRPALLTRSPSSSGSAVGKAQEAAYPPRRRLRPRQPY